MNGPVTTAVVQRMLEAAGLMPWSRSHPTGWLLGDYGMGFRLTVMLENAEASLAALPPWKFTVIQRSYYRVAYYVKPGPIGHQDELVFTQPALALESPVASAGPTDS